MKIIHVANSDINGGAARGSYRIHRSLLDNGDLKNIYSEMIVVRKFSNDSSIINYTRDKKTKILTRFSSSLNKLLKLNFQTLNPITHSNAIVSSGLNKHLNKLTKKENYDVVNLHWLGDNTLTIEEIGNIKKPIVWTLHDEWAYCGAEHYKMPPINSEIESSDKRFINGYLSKNRPKSEQGFDINKQTWNRKIKSWRKPFFIASPSNYLANCAKKSFLMNNWTIKVIPIPINNKTWAPINKKFAREMFNLPKEKILILFGAIGGSKDKRKGADLLLEALEKLSFYDQIRNLFEIELIIFGQDKPKFLPEFKFPIHYTGHLSDDKSLRLLYSAADLLVLPSRQEGLGQVGCEAQACGTPVVAFNIGGLPDVVDHLKTGYLAKPFDTASLAKGILWILEDKERYKKVCQSSRMRAELLWSPNKISNLYLNLYEEACNEYIVN